MKDERKLELTLQKFLESKPEAIAWSLNNETLQQASLQFSHYTKDSLIFTFDAIQKPYLQRLLGFDRKLRIYFESEGLFLYCKLKSESENKLYLSKPTLHEFEDRRKIIRTGKITEMQVQIIDGEKVLLTKQCTDIGPGGFSIVLMKTERNTIEHEKVYVAHIQKMKIKQAVQVLAADKIKPFEWENTPYGGTRLSFKFLDESDRFRTNIKIYLEKYKKTGF